MLLLRWSPLLPLPLPLLHRPAAASGLRFLSSFFAFFPSIRLSLQECADPRSAPRGQNDATGPRSGRRSGGSSREL